jgi:dipeptidase D
MNKVFSWAFAGALICGLNVFTSCSDGFIHSKGNMTSLGADDGIGMAIVLAVLDSKEVEHGPLECLFTWDEEQGMSGARSLKPGILQGKYMLNIDNEEVGKLLVGAAGNVHELK